LGLLGSVEAASGLAVGTPAPDFRLPSIGTGGDIGLKDFVNKKIVIVHFWKSR
jgi:peroxiredoxin